MSEEFNLPLTQDRDAFLKAHPIFCVNCKRFTDVLRKYCEHCGARNSFRKATKLDFERYIKKKHSKLKDEELQPIPSISEEERRSFLKIQRFFCDYCKNFSIRNRGYCEICGTRSSLRRARKKDFEKYYEMPQPDIQDQLKEQMPSSKPITHVTQTKTEESQALPTILEKKEVITEWKERLDKSEKVTIPSKIPVASDKKDEKPEVMAPSEIPTTPTKIEEKPKVSKPSEILPILEKKEEKPEVMAPSEIPTIPAKIEEKPKVSIPSESSPILDKIEKNCKFCGIELIPESIFCPQCGYIIKNK